MGERRVWEGRVGFYIMLLKVVVKVFMYYGLWCFKYLGMGGGREGKDIIWTNGRGHYVINVGGRILISQMKGGYVKKG